MIYVREENNKGVDTFSIIYEANIDSDYDDAIDIYEVEHKIDEMIIEFQDWLKSKEQEIANNLGSSVCNITIPKEEIHIGSIAQEFYVDITVDKGFTVEQIEDIFRPLTWKDSVDFDVEFWEEYGYGEYSNRGERAWTEYFSADITFEIGEYLDPVQLIDE